MIDHRLLTLGGRLRRGEVSADARQMFLVGGREADAFYRQRFSHDRVVRSTHGVNCTGSCSRQGRIGAHHLGRGNGNRCSSECCDDR